MCKGCTANSDLPRRVLADSVALMTRTTTATLRLISLGCLASSASALLLPLARSQATFRSAVMPCRMPSVRAEAGQASEDALAKATAKEANAVLELADAIAADESVTGCIVEADSAEVCLRLLKR